jgi:hypothetical protein
MPRLLLAWRGDVWSHAAGAISCANLEAGTVNSDVVFCVVVPSRSDEVLYVVSVAVEAELAAFC